MIMKLNIKYSKKNIILVTFLLLVLFILVYLIYADFRQKQGISLISDDLKLKSTKDKIVSFTEYPGPDGQEDIVQYIYGTDKEVPPGNYQGLSEDVAKRTPNSQTFLKSIERLDNTKVKENYVAKFYAGTTFYQSEDNNWFYTETATTTKTAFLQQTENTLADHLKSLFGQPVFAGTNTTYSGVGDGNINNNNASWPIAHDAQVSNGFVTNNSLIISSVQYSSGRYHINRAFLPFYTDSLDDNVIVTSASLNFYVFSKINFDNDGDDFITVVQTSQASNTTLVLEDYDQCGAISNPIEGVDIGSRKDISSDIVVNSLNTFNLNATGVSWIAKTGYTKLGIREGHDVKNSAVVTASGANSVLIYASEQAGTSQDPYLTIDYTSTVTKVKIDQAKVQINNATFNIN